MEKILCAICSVEKNIKTLAIHVYNKHRIKSFDYAVKYFNYPSKAPFCECGCGKLLSWKGFERGWGRFVLGHNKGAKNKTPSYNTREKISNTLKNKYKNGQLVCKHKGKTKQNCDYIKRGAEKLTGKPLSIEHRKSVSNTLKTKYKEGTIIVWNKGKTKKENASLQRTSEKLKNRKVPEYQKTKISNKIKYLHKNTDVYKGNVEKCRASAKIMSSQKRLFAQSDKGKKELSRTMREKNANGKMLIKREDLPTNPEKKIIEWFNNDLDYTGKGSFWVTFKSTHKHKNPDFVCKNNKRKIVEVFGDYYHAKKSKDYIEVIEGYKSINFECLIVWEHEINNHPEIVKSKINKFLEK